MNKALPLFLIAACMLTGCKSKSSTASGNGPGAVTSSDDPVQKKLQDLAGGGKNCGLLKSQVPAEMDSASKCAVDAAKAKTPFYVEYQLPGMNVAIAGNAQGKLFAVQSQTGGAGLTSADCPAELRVAPSGRVTCYAPGTFPMGAGAGSHTNMSMPPAMPPVMGTSGAPAALPPGHPKPHDQKPQPPPKQ